jgi:hypothetical protein
VPVPVCVVGLVGAGAGCVVAVPVDRLGSLVVGVGAGLLRTGTIVRVGGALVVGLVGAGVLVATLGFLAGVVFFTTLALGLALGFAGVFAFGFAGFGLAAGFCAGAGATGIGVD